MGEFIRGLVKAGYAGSMIMRFSSALLAFPALAGAQGDTCDVATDIFTTGAFSFDTSSMTASGYVSCGVDFHKDAFWRWTAPDGGTYRFGSCGATFDSVLALHSGGGCASSCSAFEDNDCSPNNVITRVCNTGDTYLIHVGSDLSGSGGPGSLVITKLWPVFNPSNGHSYEVIYGGEMWNDARAGAESHSYNGTPGHLVTITDQAELDFLLTLDFETTTWLGLYQDPFAPNYSEPDGGWGWVTGEPYVFTSWAINQPNDFSSANVASMFDGGAWVDLPEWTTSPDSYIIEYEPSSPALHCDPANAHSGGGSVTLANSTSSGPGLLHLEASDGPTAQFAYFLVSQVVIDPGLSVGNGQLCLGAPIGRYSSVTGGALVSLGQFDGQGVFQNLSGTSTVGSGYDVFATLPSPPGGTIGGDTYYFQCWYRDGLSSNFSNVLQFQ